MDELPSMSLSYAASGQMEGGQRVYVRDEHYAWLPAQVVSTDETNFTCQVEIALPRDWTDSTLLMPASPLTKEDANDKKRVVTIDLQEYPNGELPLQNLESRESSSLQLMNKPDMADLPFLHEAAILYNLKDRHYRGVPYTRVGDIVVAMNPFRWIEGLYSSEKQDFYAQHLIWNAKKDEKEENSDDEFEEEEGTIPGMGDVFLREHGLPTTIDGLKKKLRQESKANLSKKNQNGGIMYDKLGFDPHVYETSALCYKGLASEGVNQTILVSGESGAGKTETVKIVMGHLALMEQTRPFFKFSTKVSGNTIGAAATVERVLQSNPVFEAFGNAKTIRNNNSSRFGKFTQLQFDVESLANAKRGNRSTPSCLLAGSSCTTYLLEKSRVVSHAAGERSYHIFYQLLEAPEEYKAQVWSGLEGAISESFAYIGHAETCKAIEGQSDATSWERTRKALSVFGLENESLIDMMRALCVVLQLGNLTFEDDPAADAEDGGSVITSQNELEQLADLMGLDPVEIQVAMTCRIMKTRYDECVVNLRPHLAKEGCDALAKEIYARVFDVLVKKINEYTRAENHYEEKTDMLSETALPESNGTKTFGLISLLDIFGFECFGVNRFEQMCINYANERLQQKYVLDNFKAVQQEYEAEGIEIFDFNVVDNSDVLTLLEGKIGLIVSLNEECIRPNGSDETFVYKAKLVHGDSMTLIQEKLHKPTEFGINHFAGPVIYNAEGFVVRNTNKLPNDLMACACLSTNELIRTEFNTLVEAVKKIKNMSVRKRGGNVANHTVLTTFRSQLGHLMGQVEDTKTRYIRCIKSNNMMEPAVTDHHTTMRQLECAGLVTAVTISRETFPNRLNYEMTFTRFECLLKDDEQIPKTMELHEGVRQMLSTLLYSAAEVHQNGNVDYPFACGKTRVYFRAGALERLEIARMEFFSTRVVKLQATCRAYICRWKYRALRKTTIILQANWRGLSQWRNYNFSKYAMTILQCFVRSSLARMKLRQLYENHAAVQIQARWRTQKPRRELLKFRSAAVIIQSRARVKRDQALFSAKLAAAKEEARRDEELKDLQKQVQKDKAEKAVDETLLVEIETMFDYLRKEVYKLREKNQALRTDVEEAEEEKRDLKVLVDSSDASSSLYRLRVGQLGKTNAALIAEAAKLKKDVTGVKKEMRLKQIVHEEALLTTQEQYASDLKEKDQEIWQRNEQLKTLTQASKFESNLLKEELRKQGEDHINEVMRLKTELRKTQDSHHDYLAKLMDVLETTHTARETETTRINNEMRNMKEEKDTQILELQREVNELRKMHTMEATELNDELKKKKDEMFDAKRELEKSRFARHDRSQRFHEVAKKLEEKIVRQDNNVQVHPESTSRSLLGLKKKHTSVISPRSGSLESISEMKRMLEMLQVFYEKEEGSHSKVDENILRMMDKFLVVSEPDEAIAVYKKRLDVRETENKLLRDELDEKSICRQCEYRSQQNSSSQRIGSPDQKRVFDGSSARKEQSKPFR